MKADRKCLEDRPNWAGSSMRRKSRPEEHPSAICQAENQGEDEAFFSSGPFFVEGSFIGFTFELRAMQMAIEEVSCQLEVRSRRYHVI